MSAVDDAGTTSVDEPSTHTIEHWENCKLDPAHVGRCERPDTGDTAPGELIARDPNGTIEHPTMWIKLSPHEFGVVASCVACAGAKTFGTYTNGEIFLDTVVAEMTDHVLRNHS